MSFVLKLDRICDGNKHAQCASAEVQKGDQRGEQLPQIHDLQFQRSVLGMSIYNVLVALFKQFFQLLGLGILTIGVWAWSEKDTFNNLGKVANIALDPAFILICIGKCMSKK